MIRSTGMISALPDVMWSMTASRVRGVTGGGDRGDQDRPR